VWQKTQAFFSLTALTSPEPPTERSCTEPMTLALRALKQKHAADKIK
jgi:hypothetical protein